MGFMAKEYRPHLLTITCLRKGSILEILVRVYLMHSRLSQTQTLNRPSLSDEHSGYCLRHLRRRYSLVVECSQMIHFSQWAWEIQACCCASILPTTHVSVAPPFRSHRDDLVRATEEAQCHEALSAD